jgi:hypothetical protein
VVTETTQAAGNNIPGSVGNLLDQPNAGDDTGRIDNAAETPAQSSGSNKPSGNGVQGNDAVAILNGEDAEARPFAAATDDFLPQMRSMTTDEKVISQIDAELALRGIGAPSAVEVAGEKINKEWTAFNPDTGTLNIPRSEMPQIKAEHRGAMVNFLNARGISHDQETVPASSLKPTQQEFSEAKVKQASEFKGGNRSILVSSDNHVLDGHHQWLAKREANEPVDVIRLNAPIAQLLDDVKEFPSSTVESGATASQNNDLAQSQMTLDEFKAHKRIVNKEKFGKENPFDDNEIALQHLDYIESALKKGESVSPEVIAQHKDENIKQYKRVSKLITSENVKATNAAPKLAPVNNTKKSKPVKPKTLLATLRDLGGVSLTEKQDVTGEVKGFAPGGYNQIFKSKTTRSLKGLIESGDLDEYLPYNMRLEANGANDDAFDSTEAYDYLADKIRNGESVLPYAVVEELQALAYQGDAVNDVADE